jgi:hypothetical protein
MEAAIPGYYVVKRNLSDAEVQVVQHALKFTPISAVIVSDAHDIEVATRFSQEVIQTNAVDVHAVANKLSAEAGCFLLVVGETEGFLDACYPDGTREKVQIHAEESEEVHS